MRRKLLLADDSITVQRVIELTFADEDLEIATVGDGGQAIALIERDRPDIVFADLTMPVRDGYGVAEHVKRTAALVGQTRVVLLTGAFEPVDQERVGLLGVDGVLAKPFQPRAAIELVRELLAKPPLAPRPRDERTAAAGYPFEPGAGAGRSTPAELDDYFQRLDEALASAGLVASAAVRDMLAESKGSRDSAAAAAGEGRKTDGKQDGKDGTAAASGAASAAADAGTAAGSQSTTVSVDKAAPGTGGAAPGVAAALESLTGAVKEKKTQMSAVTSGMSAGTPGAAPASGTLVDAFSALLAAEQGETGSADTAPGEARTADTIALGDGASDPLAAAFAAPAPAAVDTASGVANGAEPSTPARESAGTGTGTAGAGPSAPAPATASSGLSADAAAAVAALPLTDELLDALARRIVTHYGERIIREAVTAQVVDIAERLVREEIERLKAAAERA